MTTDGEFGVRLLAQAWAEIRGWTVEGFEADQRPYELSTPVLRLKMCD